VCSSDLIEIPGYTRKEKLDIAKSHLLPKQLEEHGIKKDQIEITTKALEDVIDHHTREAGVRNLERQIATVIRGLAVKVAEGNPGPFKVDGEDDLRPFLGPPRFISDVAERTAETGVATGLAWTSVGGEILFIEATRMHGSGKLQLTGQLGDVMKESAQTAMSFVRTRAKQLDIPEDFLDKHDIHIHIPAGAMPKDGPSAGVTMMTALVSLLTGMRVRADVAMTGEITLRGRVLPVGGIKEKVLAAHRAGVKRVILPERNVADLEEVPAEIQQELEFIGVSRMDEVLRAALVEGSQIKLDLSQPDPAKPAEATPAS
jgi:ATP-dependent Lon protease